MPHAERVVFALVALRERRDAVLLLHGVDRVAATGQDLVRVALVADVPDEAVERRLEDMVQRDRQFDDAQPRAEMAAGLADLLDQVRPQFVGDRGKLRFRDATQVGRFVDTRQMRVTLGVHQARPGGQTPIVPRAAGRRQGEIWRESVPQRRKRPSSPPPFAGSAGGGPPVSGSATPTASDAFT